MKLKEYKFLVQFKDGTEKIVPIRQCEGHYIDRDLAMAAVRKMYKGKIKSIRNAPDKTIV